MTPTATATARRSSAIAGGAVRPVPGRAPAGDRRPPLKVVDTGLRRRRRARKHSIAAMLSVSSLVVALLAVVVGHAVLASGQVRLSEQQVKVAAAQAQHRRMELATAELQTPSRIVARAEQQLHMQQPSRVTQLPSVPLDVPVPAPRMYAVPATPTTTTPTTTTPTTTAPTPTPTAAGAGH